MVKKKAVMTLLEDDEWCVLSNREIAKHCKVSSRYVDKLRINLTGANVRTPKNNNTNNQDVSSSENKLRTEGTQNDNESANVPSETPTEQEEADI